MCPMQVTVPVVGCDLGTLCQVDDPGLLSFLSQLLAVDPGRRPTAAEALEHPWLQQQLVRRAAGVASSRSLFIFLPSRLALT